MKRCDLEACSIIIDANLVGVGGIKEPRRVSVIVLFDAKNKELQLSRMVCTFPDNNVKVCRDWDTGKLIMAASKDSLGNWQQDK